METLIIAGGFYTIGLIVFHLLFWRIFDWEQDLKRISFLNRATMQVLNISLTFCFIIFSYISLVHTAELLTSSLGHSLLLLIALFWLIRAFQQIIFYKLHHRASWAFLLLFLSGSLLYAIPVFYIIQPA
jgi:hypothetical protein